MNRVSAAYTAIDATARPEAWIHLADRSEVEAEFTGAAGPLAGLLLAVKNNVDVAGWLTTAACPGYATAAAATDAPAVARLRAAGATVVGATNLDQFATGLVGQRSPYGGVRDARRPEYVSGGSSSGSAVAVALGLVDIAIGTDTAGSGRVPAALQGIVGVKPTLGVVSTDGVVPACRSWDAVTILARDLGTANDAMVQMAGGAGTRPWPSQAPLAAPSRLRLAVPAELPGMSAGWQAAFEACLVRLREDGVELVAIDLAPFLDAARLLYDGALVAERHAAVGGFVDRGPEGLDPIVGSIIGRAGRINAADLVADLARLDTLRTEAFAQWSGCDALLVPTVPGHPTIDQVAADPFGVNAWLGTFTNFCNLFDLSAVAVPAGSVADPDGSRAQFGVTVFARAFHDAVALDVARRIERPTDSVAAPGSAAPRPLGLPWPTPHVHTARLFVIGAHLPGQPLAAELESLGARWLGEESTSPEYALRMLDTEPVKPGLVHVGPGGASIDGGMWLLSTGALGEFLRQLPAPMNLGSVTLADGSTAVGFGCVASVGHAAVDITEFGGWLAWLDSRRS